MVKRRKCSDDDDDDDDDDDEEDKDDDDEEDKDEEKVRSMRGLQRWWTLTLQVIDHWRLWFNHDT